MRLGKLLCAAAVMALLGAVWCSGAFAAQTIPDIVANTSAELKSMLEAASMQIENMSATPLKHIDTVNGLVLNDSVKASGASDVFIGGVVNEDLLDTSLTIASGVVIDIPAWEGSDVMNMKAVTFRNGITSRAYTLPSHQRSTLYLKGTINVGAQSQLIFAAQRDASIPNDMGSLNVVHTGTINVAERGMLSCAPESVIDGMVRTVPVTYTGSTGSIVLSKGAILVSAPDGLFIDSGVRVSVPAQGGIMVQPSNETPSTTSLTAGTYKYDPAQNAYVKDGSAPSPSTKPSPMPSPSADPNPSPSFDPDDYTPILIPAPSSDNGTVSVDDEGGKVYFNPPSDLIGYTYKGTVSLGLTYSDPSSAVTLTIEIPTNYGSISKGTSGLVAFIKKKGKQQYDSFDVALIADNTIRFTVSPVGDYFSESEVIIAQKNGVNPPPASTPQPTKEPGGSSGGGGCSNGFGAIAVMALAVLAMRRKG